MSKGILSLIRVIMAGCFSVRFFRSHKSLKRFPLQFTPTFNLHTTAPLDGFVFLNEGESSIWLVVVKVIRRDFGFGTQKIVGIMTGFCSGSRVINMAKNASSLDIKSRVRPHSEIAFFGLFWRKLIQRFFTKTLTSVDCKPSNNVINYLCLNTYDFSV